MSDYISREVLLDMFENADADVCESYPDGYSRWGFSYKTMREVIKNIPSADVALVVRCKDCKHFNRNSMECENEAVSTDHEGGASYSLNFWLDDYCSYGERKDGECE